MRLVIIAVGLILTVIWITELWSQNAARKRRERDREREANYLKHIVGSSRKWWEEPSEDDEGDY